MKELSQRFHSVKILLFAKIFYIPLSSVSKNMYQNISSVHSSSCIIFLMEVRFLRHASTRSIQVTLEGKFVYYI